MEAIKTTPKWVTSPIPFNKESIANILSMFAVCNVCRITMDRANTQAIHVHRMDGSIMTFSEHPSGLFMYDSNVYKPDVTGYTLVNTVAEQKKLFTPRQIRAADSARALYQTIGRPSEPTFRRIL
jgi:hypothetical protein